MNNKKQILKTFLLTNRVQILFSGSIKDTEIKTRLKY